MQPNATHLAGSLSYRYLRILHERSRLMVDRAQLPANRKESSIAMKKQDNDVVGQVASSSAALAVIVATLEAENG